MQHSRRTLGERGRVLARVHPEAGSFHSNQTNLLVVHKLVEEANGVGATPHAREQQIRLAAPLLLALAARLAADARVEVAHQHGVRVGTCGGAQDVVRGLHVGDPVPNRLRGGVLEGGRASCHWAHLRSQEAHAKHVQGLALHVLSTHVDDALEAEASTHSGGGHAVLACTGLSYDAFFAHAKCEQSLSKGVIDLMCPSVVEIFALEIHLHTVAQAL
mmetsp:Transcript_18399/g.35003  ORF Transcript_18399/g.35003 Transcript_18399/m.35003 type:complete len:217 (-) Transcript_18399:530-1180(-)